MTCSRYLATDNAPQDFQTSKGEDILAFSCLSVLRDSLSLLDPSISVEQQLLQVLSSRYAILTYAIDYWAEHLISSATRNRLEPNSHTALSLASFDTLQMQYCQKVGRAVDQHHFVQTIDARLEAISHLPSMSLCANYLAFQKNCKSQAASTGEGKFHHPSPPPPVANSLRALKVQFAFLAKTSFN